MKKYYCNIIFKINFFIIVLSVVSCETYGPASRYQVVRAMERPSYDGTDTSATYAAVKLGFGVQNQAEDKNKTAELSLHRSWVFRDFYASVGAYGQYGEYKLKDSAAFNYTNFGLRTEVGYATRFDNMEIEFLNLSIARGYESGSFYEFRKKYEQTRNDAVVPPFKWITEFQSHLGVRHLINKNQSFGFQIGFGYSFNNYNSMFSFLNTSFQFNKNMHANFNLVSILKVIDNQQNTSNNIFSMGLTYGF